MLRTTSRINTTETIALCIKSIINSELNLVHPADYAHF